MIVIITPLLSKLSTFNQFSKGKVAFTKAAVAHLSDLQLWKLSFCTYTKEKDRSERQLSCMSRAACSKAYQRIHVVKTLACLVLGPDGTERSYG